MLIPKRALTDCCIFSYKDKQLGFTLLELLVVLVIIAIISTTSIGALRFFGEQTARTFQIKSKSLIVLGIDEAVLTGKVHGLFRSDNALILRKFVRPRNNKQSSASTTETGNVLTSLVDLAVTSQDQDTKTGSATSKYASGDPGDFAQDGSGVWVDLDIGPLLIPDRFEVIFKTDETVGLKELIAAHERTKQQKTASAQEYTKDEKEEDRIANQKEDKPKQNKLITTFWPSGLIRPAGTVTISDTEKTDIVKVRWLSSAEIEATDNAP